MTKFELTATWSRHRPERHRRSDATPRPWRSRSRPALGRSRWRRRPRPANPAPRLAPVVVTATRTEVAPFDVPASIDRIGSETHPRRAGCRSTSPRASAAFPGVLARDRQNYAQDVQISVRGFGARSSFGIRGVRMYVDGIPATLPDGQGQITNVDLGSTDRIEVLRGPFSSLYGNSAGGVIQVFTEEGSGAPDRRRRCCGRQLRHPARRRQGERRDRQLRLCRQRQRLRHRRLPRAQRSRAPHRQRQAHLAPDDASKWTFVVNSVALPKAQDPLGLTRAEYEADPRGVDPAAMTFNTRKTVDQTQLGLIYERRLDAVNSLRALVYDGHRSTEQFQAIPVGPQASPLHPGGVIDARLATTAAATCAGPRNTRLGDAPFTVVAGLTYDALAEQRRGFQNFIGPTLGVEGALQARREQRRLELRPVPAGVVAARAALDACTAGCATAMSGSRPRITTSSAPIPTTAAASASARTLPVVGVMFAASDEVHLYATAGRGFETPTLNELAYRPNGATGLNLALGSATSNSFEVGVKTRTRVGRPQPGAVRDPHRQRDRDAQQRRRPVDVPERRRDATPRPGGGVEPRAAREPARPGRLHLARRALSRHVHDLHGDAVRDAEPDRSGRQFAARAGPPAVLRRPQLDAAARLARRRRAFARSAASSSTTPTPTRPPASASSVPTSATRRGSARSTSRASSASTTSSRATTSAR